MKTKVIFYKEPFRDVMAYFPEINEGNGQRNDLKLCYSHIGQHSACAPEYIKKCKEAKQNEYAVLLKELIGQGYNDLQILNNTKDSTLIEKTIKPFVNSYLATAAWVTCDSDENTGFTREAIKRATSDCKIFIDKVFSEFTKEDAENIINQVGRDLSHLAAHDFFLTRNGHGSGFWDKEEIYGKEASKKLTDISKGIGEVNCYHVRGKKSKLTFD